MAVRRKDLERAGNHLIEDSARAVVINMLDRKALRALEKIDRQLQGYGGRGYEVEKPGQEEEALLSKIKKLQAQVNDVEAKLQKRGFTTGTWRESPKELSLHMTSQACEKARKIYNDQLRKNRGLIEAMLIGTKLSLFTEGANMQVIVDDFQQKLDSIVGSEDSSS